MISFFIFMPLMRAISSKTEHSRRTGFMFSSHVFYYLFRALMVSFTLPSSDMYDSPRRWSLFFFFFRFSCVLFQIFEDFGYDMWIHGVDRCDWIYKHDIHPNDSSIVVLTRAYAIKGRLVPNSLSSRECDNISKVE